MNGTIFSEAIGAIDSKYIDKALNYRPKRKVHILPFAASLTILLLLCGFAYTAHVYWGVGPAEWTDISELTQPFGTVAGEQLANQKKDSRIFYEKSSLISNYTNVYADCSVCVTTEENVIPPLYFSPNYMVIFTQGDEKGWALETGDELTLHISLHQAQSLELETGYIVNGEYHLLSLAKGNDFNETLTAADAGKYFICVTNRSSTNAVIRAGEILSNRPVRCLE